MTGAMLRAEGLGRSHGVDAARTVALADVDLTVAAGELVVVAGASGSGKTTLLTLLAGLDRPTAGSAWVGALRVSDAREPELAALRRDRLGFVAQEFALVPVLTAAENVEMPLRLARTAVPERRARVAAVLDALGLAPHTHQRPDELSGGQQQRAALARALVIDPDVLVADEPTAQLDAATAAAVTDLLVARAHDLGAAVLVATHDPVLVERADRVVTLRDGRLTDPRAAGTALRRDRRLRAR